MGREGVKTFATALCPSCSSVVEVIDLDSCDDCKRALCPHCSIFEETPKGANLYCSRCYESRLEERTT
jgi:hypothetical protein